jgi:hypothetical protein
MYHILDATACAKIKKIILCSNIYMFFFLPLKITSTFKNKATAPADRPLKLSSYLHNTSRNVWETLHYSTE